jgi:hypothetical protein
VRRHAPRWRAGALPVADLEPLEQAMADGAWDA